jgi:hypothetical protein
MGKWRIPANKEQNKMSIIFTSRQFPKDWEQYKDAVKRYTTLARVSGCTMSKVYRRDGSPGEILWISEWPSHDVLHKFGDQIGDEMNTYLVSPETDDAAWVLSDAAEI